MVTPIDEDRLLSIEKKLTSLIARLEDLERRVTALEQAPTSPPTQNSEPSAKSPASGATYSYLRRSIEKAKRDYGY